MKKITPVQLKQWLSDGDEIAALDIRRLGPYSRGHLWVAISLPFAVLEQKVRRFVSRLATRVVLFDDADGLAEEAALLLERLGYTNLYSIEGGVSACEESGFALTDGNYVIQHAFGFFLKDEYNIPLVSAEDLKAGIDVGDEPVLIDSRPLSEFSANTIPGSTNIPAAEVPGLAGSVIPESSPSVLFHCGGITRGVLGAHALMLSGATDKVAAMDHGTKGWLASGQETILGKNPDHALAKIPLGQDVIHKIAETYRLSYISADELIALQQDAGRTTYLVDVRSPDDYLASHVAGALSIPGEELAGMTNDVLGTWNARLCLIGDPDTGNAEVTACWMKHLGWDVMIVKDWAYALALESGNDPSLPQEADDQTGPVSVEDFDSVSTIPDGVSGEDLLKAHRDYNLWRENLYERYKAQDDFRFVSLDEIIG